ncbi:hypothetical protein MRB53_007932 [Persea americana]|uniref:Uncharacterized protein n=1 Tax=Persea americana TaxID=3435 RepID=A0ACC2MLG6_PERAE|nr:hypothetical protein MRB53_007932 [Persea americana]|eukprot:TRINITY_DN4649_c0_g1_i1.p1 TRINITY_DN4649_c0_g1~~TRINITY_DN4649_c0_g1_i1.p1  ORF type:complete len:487 (-),score=98.14 TRINITY_DN4649_c0_g1_i1:404-1864(-)
MGALNEGHLDEELENGVKVGFFELGPGGDLDTSVIEDAVKVLLQGLGEDPCREGLRKTPLRVAKAFREGTRGYHQKVKDIIRGALFPEAGLHSGVGHAGGAGGLVVVRDVDLFSYCESCLLPFRVKCHVGYIPAGQRVVGLSKLSRVADVFAKRLQDPQRLANEVCTALHNSIKPAGVAIFLQCWHIKFPAVEKSCQDSSHATKIDVQGWSRVSVWSGSGVFENENSDAWGDFTTLTQLRGVKMERNLTQAAIQCWCPSKSQEALACNGHSYRVSSKAGVGLSQPAMIAAATSILHSLGEDPLRKELLGTPQRFVQWLMNFKRCNLEVKLNGLNYGKTGPTNFGLMHKKRGGDVCYDHNGIHSELNLPFLSQCEHHLLPFHGVVHIGYLCSEEAEAIDRSILQSTVDFHGCKLQVQERLTRQIAETAASIFGRGVVVVVEANHTCMISRGIEKVASSTATIAVIGQFSTDPAAKAMFLNAISNSRV